MKVLVTGAHGHLGAAVVQAFGPHADVAAFPRRALDITAYRDVRRVIDHERPDVVINCAAYNDVDGAEDDPTTALEVNGIAVSVLARAAGSVGATFVHYSSDFVFDGTATRPYVEDDVPTPRGTYACSKRLGEYLAADAERHYVLRVESLFGGPTALTLARPGTYATLLAKLKAGETISIFTDRVVSPSYAPDVAAATRALLAADLTSGVYHCVNAGSATWEELVTAAARLLGLPPHFKRITTAEAALRAPRPVYSVLSPGRLARHGIVMRPWQDAVQAWLTQDQSQREAGGN